MPLGVLMCLVALAPLGFLQSPCRETVPAGIKAAPVSPEVRKAADSGDAHGEYQLALAYEFGCGIETDLSQAAQWMRRAAEHGDVVAQENLGVMYHLGDGVPKDAAEAMKWYGRAAKQGNAAAMFNIGIGFFNGPTTGEAFQQDYKVAYAWMTLANDFGSKEAKDGLTHFELRPDAIADAEARVANAYLMGEAVPKNRDKGLQWLDRAIADGSDRAEYEKGMLYLKGVDVPKDEHLALATLTKSVNRQLNHVPADACLTIAGMYEEGRGTPKNMKMAVNWYEEASVNIATRSAASLRLAKIFEEGNGVKPDIVRAYVELLLAKKSGAQQVDSELSRLSGKMTAKQIKKAEEEAHSPTIRF